MTSISAAGKKPCSLSAMRTLIVPVSGNMTVSRALACGSAAVSKKRGAGTSGLAGVVWAARPAVPARTRARARIKSVFRMDDIPPFLNFKLTA